MRKWHVVKFECLDYYYSKESSCLISFESSAFYLCNQMSPVANSHQGQYKSQITSAHISVLCCINRSMGVAKNTSLS